MNFIISMAIATLIFFVVGWLGVDQGDVAFIMLLMHIVNGRHL